MQDPPSRKTDARAFERRVEKQPKTKFAIAEATIIAQHENSIQELRSRINEKLGELEAKQSKNVKTRIQRLVDLLQQKAVLEDRINGLVEELENTTAARARELQVIVEGRVMELQALSGSTDMHS